MKAIVIERFGTPDVLTMAEIDQPVPAAGEVRVKVETIAVARAKDVAARAGRPPFGAQITDFPHVLGTEHAGVVDAVGDGVDVGLVGQRVAVSAVLTCGNCRACSLAHEEACTNFSLLGVHTRGSYAQFSVVPVENISAVPDDVSLTDAASIAANGPVARAQLEAADVGSDSVVLVIGAGGSLGSMSASLAAWRGARVIGVDRISAHPDVLDGLPLAARVDGDATDLGYQLRAAAGSWGIDCVIDNLGLPAVWEAYRPVVADMGRIIVSGTIVQDPLPMTLLPFYLHSQSLIGVRTGNRMHMGGIWHDVRSGFRAPASHTHAMPWTEVARAHALVEAGTAHGQSVLEVS